MNERRPERKHALHLHPEEIVEAMEFARFLGSGLILAAHSDPNHETGKMHDIKVDLIVSDPNADNFEEIINKVVPYKVLENLEIIAVQPAESEKAAYILDGAKSNLQLVSELIVHLPKYRHKRGMHRKNVIRHFN